jgi:hypothetical protein
MYKPKKEKMNHSLNNPSHFAGAGCSCCPGPPDKSSEGLSRRRFLQVTGTSALATLAMPELSWAALSSARKGEGFEITRKPLVVKPILTYETPVRREQWSWRNWGGIETQDDAIKEIRHIESELAALKGKADFPVEFLPVSGVRNTEELNGLSDLGRADLFLVYAAGGGSGIFNSLHERGKNLLFFCRHRSGPVSLWYEIISPRYLRQHTDKLAMTGLDFNDVVIDSQDEILWRLRSLCGLKNTLATRIIAIGGPGAWAQPRDVVPDLVRQKYRFDIHTVSYDDLGSLIAEAMADKSVVSRAKSRASQYLKDNGLKLETKREFVDNCFVLEDVFIRIMDKMDCRALTINGCMGTIMPISHTAACMTLGLLNDAGYLAFCESDFVVIPAGILMANISGKPVFLCNPTYPHNNEITLSHCVAPRRMDGRNLEPARLLTHFESDYGAAPKVDMRIGQTVTNIISDFAVANPAGLLGKITENPFMPICRTQINIGFDCDNQVLAEKMRGFHWITVYGDYLKESGYALKKIGIELEKLG